MDWDKFKKKAAGMALQATAAMREEMGNQARSLSRQKGLSSEKRDELKRKAESYKSGAKQMRNYYDENFRQSDQEDEE